MQREMEDCDECIVFVLKFYKAMDILIKIHGQSDGFLSKLGTSDATDSQFCRAPKEQLEQSYSAWKHILGQHKGTFDDAALEYLVRNFNSLENINKTNPKRPHFCHGDFINARIKEDV